ncbi:hypothetical protein GURASL_37400 [Geotalea uraniireducens]|uniref:Uncharacterized protein n=1 Tax=Geotalea uraniireducens TaxID=351604 RepID=A0ABM8EQI5_9BACT|nr:hypothetical protein [Geotalea uraniireducens]BDV44817.1 hypothetical protein GURASL_37400 [Geotalea uraniireducens]
MVRRATVAVSFVVALVVGAAVTWAGPAEVTQGGTANQQSPVCNKMCRLAAKKQRQQAAATAPCPVDCQSCPQKTANCPKNCPKTVGKTVKKNCPKVASKGTGAATGVTACPLGKN